MPYSAPNVEITQVIAPTASSAGVASLKGCVLGPAFQIVTDEQAAGTYAGTQATFAFGVINVDVGLPSEGALTSEWSVSSASTATGASLAVTLKDVRTELLAPTGPHTNAFTGPFPGPNNTFTLTAGDAFIAFTPGAEPVADGLQPGSFIRLADANVADTYFLIDSVDAAGGRINLSAPNPFGGPGFSWDGTSTAAGVAIAEVVMPFIPVGIAGGASSFFDLSRNFDTTPPVSDAGTDRLVVVEPTTYAGSIDIASAAANSLTLDGSFVSPGMVLVNPDAPVATFASGSPAVTNVEASVVTAIAALRAAGDEVSIMNAVSGAINDVGSATGTTITLTNNYLGGGGGTQLFFLLPSGPTTNWDYRLEREQPDQAPLREDYPYLGIGLSATGVTLPAGLTAAGAAITNATVHFDYRALDETLATLKEYANLVELAADFTAGTSALIPANPYGYAMKLAFGNTAGAMSALGVDATFFTDEETAYEESFVKLIEQDIYTITLCTQNSAVFDNLDVHVTAMSAPPTPGPYMAAWRIGIFNRKLITLETKVPAAGPAIAAEFPNGVQPSGTSFIDPAGDYIVKGVVAGNLLSIEKAMSVPIGGRAFSMAGQRFFTDSSNGFPGVQTGDLLVIDEGGADDGAYYIAQNETANNRLVLSSNDGNFTPTAFTGVDVSNEAVTNWAPAAVVGAATGTLPGGTITVLPVEPSTLNIDPFEIDLTNFETTTPGLNATPTTYNITVPGPIAGAGSSPANDVVCDITGATGNQRITFHGATDVPTLTVASGTFAIGGGTLINRGAGTIAIQETAGGSNESGVNWIVDYRGSVGPGTADAAGTITGFSILPGSTVNAGTGNITLNTNYNPQVNGGAGTGAVVAQITADYTPRQAYAIGAQSSSSPLVGEHTTLTVAASTLGFASDIRGDLATLGGGVGWSVEYTVEKELSLSEQATALATAASGIGNRRMYMTWPDIALATVNNVADTQVPGWAWGGPVAALVSTLPSQQGLTRYSIAGLTGRQHGKDHFLTNARLDTIAGGGTMLFEQASAASPVVIRHQLSTDMSSIFLQELSFTKNLDSITKTFYLMLDGLLGQYNITDGLFTVIKTKVQGKINSMIANTVPKFGGQLKPGSQLASLAINPTLVDTVDLTITALCPVPLNKISVTINASS